MAAYFIDREVSKSEADFPQPSDELIYDDERIPPKLACPFLSNEVLMRGVLKSWTGEELELYDNSAPFFDSFRVEEEAGQGPQGEKPEVGYNLRYEKIEKTPSVLKYRLCFGKGEATFYNGCKYTGDMAFSMMHGRGVLEAENFIYSGTFRSGEIEGNGKYEWENAVYEGDLKRGLRNGEGTLTFKSGVTYTGNWREGLRDGQGKLTFPDGQFYEGAWQNGLKHGHGVQQFASGNYYEGDFENDLRSGQGTMYWLTSNEKYTGQWREGLPNGYGVHIWLDSFGSGVKQLRNRYVGQWLNGLRHGYGIFYYANGSKYEGSWVENKKDGDGVYTYEDGSTYQGPFANDHMVNRTVTGFVDVKTEEKSPALASPVAPANLDVSRRPARVVPSRGPPPAPAPAVQTKKSRISGSRAKKLIEMNPYKGLIDISDLLELEADELRAEKEVQNVLLKYNSDLKSWYLQYSTQVEAEEREESFTMTSRQLWRFLRDCQILSYVMTVAQVNRLLILGKKSNFSLDSYEPPKLDIRPSRSPTPMQATPLLDISKINPQAGESFNEDYESDDDEVVLSSDLRDMELEDVHKPNRTLLQRQFVEALVRVAFLKYSNGGVLELTNEVVSSGEQTVEMELPKSQIGIAVFRLFREKLAPLAGQSSYLPDKKEQALQEGLTAIPKDAAEALFSKLAKTDRCHINGRLDQTVEVRTFLNFLKDKAIVPSKLPETKFFELVEMGHDPQVAYTKLLEANAKPEALSMALFMLLGMELVKTEFVELLVHVGSLVAANDDRRLKAKPVKERLKRFFDLVSGINKQQSALSGDNTGAQPDVSQRPSDSAVVPPVPVAPKITLPSTVFQDRGRKQVITGKLAIGIEKEKIRKEEQDRLERDRRLMKLNDVNIDIVPFQGA